MGKVKQKQHLLRDKGKGPTWFAVGTSLSRSRYTPCWLLIGSSTEALCEGQRELSDCGEALVLPCPVGCPSTSSLPGFWTRQVALVSQKAVSCYSWTSLFSFSPVVLSLTTYLASISLSLSSLKYFFPKSILGILLPS